MKRGRVGQHHSCWTSVSELLSWSMSRADHCPPLAAGLNLGSVVRAALVNLNNTEAVSLRGGLGGGGVEGESSRVGRQRHTL